MFNEHVEEQILEWKAFRRKLAASQDPLTDVVKFWSMAPLVGKNLDIYRPETWPNPWQIISEKRYCDVTLAIMMAHTVDLSGLFDEPVLIKVLIDSDIKAMYNVCTIQDKILNYNHREVVLAKDLPNSVYEQFSTPLVSFK
jgi:hypothetical protein